MNRCFFEIFCLFPTLFSLFFSIKSLSSSYIILKKRYNILEVLLVSGIMDSVLPSASLPSFSRFSHLISHQIFPL